MQYFDVLSVLSETDRKKVRENADDILTQILSEMTSDTVDKIPKELGERIVREFQDKNNSYQLGIARTKGNFAQDIFKNGYKIFGNNNSSFGISYYNVDNYELLYILHQIVAAPYYKSSDKVYIFKIPKESINYYEEGKSLPILMPDQEKNELGFESVRLLPEYILGYIPVGKDFIGNLVENPNYKNEHNYLADGLLYDEKVEYSKNNSLKYKNKEVNQNVKGTEFKTKKILFNKIWNKFKNRILNRNNKALPEGKEETNYLKPKIKQNEMEKYYVGEVKQSEEFINNQQQGKENKSKNEFLR